jgi:hypothetical protein
MRQRIERQERKKNERRGTSIPPIGKRKKDKKRNRE